MGTVHAKAEEERSWKLPEHKVNYDDCDKSAAKEISLDGVQARVDKINVEGLARTKDDIVKDCLAELFEASDFQDVLIKAHRVRIKLDELGCFKNIGVFIDTSKGPTASKDGLEVTFNVKEHNRIIGGVSTHVGNNEGSLAIGARTPNLFGRGERVQFEYTHGTKGTSNYNLAFIKPFRGKRRPIFSASVFQSHTECPPSGYKELSQGFMLDLGFNSTHLLKHNLAWLAAINDLQPLGKDVSFAAREQAGVTMKSALRHTLSMDLRDDNIFPSCGLLARFTTEVAGLGGNIGFLKNDVYLQTNYSLAEDYVLQLVLSGGHLRGLGNDTKITISDMFFLGGPTSLRGFEMRGAGPQSEGSATGSSMFWAAGCHLFTPLPFRPGKGGLGELFRSHLWINAGNVGNFARGNPLEEALNNMRLSYGLGLALRLGNMARVEVNYCFPVTGDKADRSQPGIQFGIGVLFL